MPTKRKSQKITEEFVRRVLAKNFNQQIDNKTLREVAEKVKEAIDGGMELKKSKNIPKRAA